MITALEQHLAARARQELTALAAETGLFTTVRTLTGTLDLPASPPLAGNEVAVLVALSDLQPCPDNQDLGPAPLTEDSVLRFTVTGALRLVSAQTVYAPDAGRTISPAEASIHQADITFLALLASLRERPVPAATGASAPGGLGARLPGEALIAQGGQTLRLTWTGFTSGPASVTARNNGKERQWHVAIAAGCTFRVSPAPLEDGRILQVEHQETAPARTSLSVRR